MSGRNRPIAAECSQGSKRVGPSSTSIVAKSAKLDKNRLGISPRLARLRPDMARKRPLAPQRANWARLRANLVQIRRTLATSCPASTISRPNGPPEFAEIGPKSTKLSGVGRSWRSSTKLCDQHRADVDQTLSGIGQLRPELPQNRPNAGLGASHRLVAIAELLVGDGPNCYPRRAPKLSNGRRTVAQRSRTSCLRRAGSHTRNNAETPTRGRSLALRAMAKSTVRIRTDAVRWHRCAQQPRALPELFHTHRLVAKHTKTQHFLNNSTTHKNNMFIACIS